MLAYVSSLRIFVRVSGFAPISPVVPSPPGETKSLDFWSRLRIYVLFHLKVTKLFVLQQLWLGPSQLINNFLHKMITNDGFGNYHKQLLLLIKDKQRLYQQFNVINRPNSWKYVANLELRKSPPREEWPGGGGGGGGVCSPFPLEVQQLDMYVLSFWQSPATWHVCVVFLTEVQQLDMYVLFFWQLLLIISVSFTACTIIMLLLHYRKRLSEYRLAAEWPLFAVGSLYVGRSLVRNRWAVFQLGQNRRALRPSCPPWRPSCPPLHPSALPCALLAPLMPPIDFCSSRAVLCTTIY